ncbi:hypothetical protein GCM10008949_12610 [Deinococcus humi]|nr:hypothetical protein GCM10008949_12610 [Deinococcus humi]
MVSTLKQEGAVRALSQTQAVTLNVMFRLPHLLSPRLLLAGLALAATSCAPRVTLPQTQISSGVSVNGRLLTVTLVNRGPYDLLLKNDCPRPFSLSVLDTAKTGQPDLKYGQFQVCVASYLPPKPWNIGEQIQAVVEFPQETGLRTLEAQASVNVKLASNGTGPDGFRTIQVKIPAFQVNIK